MPSQKLAILKDTLAYSGSTIIVQGIAFLLGLFIRKVLGPEAMGIWALLHVYLSYVAYANLGIFGAVYRKIPVLRGSGEEEKIESIKNTALSYVSCSSTVVSLLIVAGTVIFKHKLSETMFWGLLCLAPLNLLQRANNFQIQILYTDKKFTFVSGFKIFSAVANAILTVVFVWKFHLYGLYAATLLSYLFNVLYLACLGGLHFQLQWNKEELKELIFFGIPLVGLNFANKLFFTIDKVVIGKYFGLTDLGIYSIAIMASSTIFMIPNMFQIVLFPRTLEKFGETNNQGREKFSTLPGRLVSIYSCLAIACCWIVTPYLCDLILPKYIQGIPALKILVFGGTLLALTQQMSHILLGYKRHLWMLPATLILCAFVWGSGYFARQMEGNITSISLLTTLSYLIGYIISVFLALQPIFRVSQILQQLGSVLSPLLITAGILLAFDRSWPIDSWISVLAKMMLFGLLWLGTLFAFQKKSTTIRVMKDAFWEWRASKKRDRHGVLETTNP